MPSTHTEHPVLDRTPVEVADVTYCLLEDCIYVMGANEHSHFRSAKAVGRAVLDASNPAVYQPRHVSSLISVDVQI